MSTYSGRKQPPYILLALLALAILLDRFWIAGLLPWASGLAGVNPSLVFFDIPVSLPLTIDLPVVGLFFLFYSILLLSYPSRYGALTWQEWRKRVGKISIGTLVIVLCLSAGGAIYYVSQGLLSREVRNGIDSFGLQADIYTPIPDHEIIHLKGSAILLVCFFIGMRFFVGITRAAGILPETAMADNQISERAIADRPLSERQAPADKTIVDPRISGFQEKERRAATKATSVPIVAPRRVELQHT